MEMRRLLSRLSMIFRHIRKAVSFSYRLGIRYFLNLISAYFVLPCIMAILPLYAMVNRQLRSLTRSLNREMVHWQSRKEEVLELGKRGYSIGIGEIGLKEKELNRLKKLLQCKAEVVIAEVDQDGGILSYYGEIEGLPTISREDFLPKTRFSLKVCALNDTIILKKQYNVDKIAFLNELSTLHTLAVVGCNVPAIIDVDFDNLQISTSFIPGYTVQEILAQHGALIRDRDIKRDMYLMSLTSKDRVRFYQEEGSRTLSSVINTQLIDKVYLLVKQSHKVGIELYDIKYGNVIVEKTTGKLFLIDFDSTRRYSNLRSKTFAVQRDRDIEKFNLFFNADKLTYQRIKDRIAHNDIPGIDNLYAPVYFGYGLRVGPLWDVNTGYGRWHFILKDRLLPLDGKRILSLGANCAFNEIQMLRYGAKEVIGLEIDEQWIAQGLFFKEAFEWADNDSYNFKYIKEDMAKLPSMDLDNFDMVIALCSLYYLSDEDMLRVAKYVSTITDTFIVQCNTRRDIGRDDDHSYEKASVEYNMKLLQQAGFSTIEVVAPRAYSRPILIGKKDGRDS